MTVYGPPDSRGVVITGIGLVTPLGPDRETTWNRLLEGHSATSWLTHAPTAATRFLGQHAGAPVFRTGPTTPSRLGIQLAAEAALEALADAGLESGLTDPERTGCVIGTSKGDIRGMAALAQSDTAPTAGPRTDWLDVFPNAPASRVATRLGILGPVLSPVAACATGLACAVRAVELIRRGDCDLVLCGSSDTSLCESVLASFARLGVLAKNFQDPATACRPFDRNRSGFLVGEGAAVLVMESEETARHRRANPLARWLAGGLASDPSGPTAVDPSGRSLSRLITTTLEQAQLDPEDLDHVNLHGTATPTNDRCETAALKHAFGQHASKLSCTSNKGGLGHLLGAAGSVELAATVLALRDQVVPPTVNLQDADPECDLDYTPQVARERPVHRALKLSLGFGGHIAAGLVEKFTAPRLGTANNGRGQGDVDRHAT